PPSNTKRTDSSAQKRSSAKRMGQFLLCFAFLLIFVLPAPAKKLARHMSPELYQMYLYGDPDMKIDVIIQYNKRHARNGWNTWNHRKDDLRQKLDVVNADHKTIKVKDLDDLAENDDVKYLSWD